MAAKTILAAEVSKCAYYGPER